MQFDLLCHPQSPRPPVEAIRVDVLRKTDGCMLLHYSVEGDLGGIVLPPLAPTGRGEDLWKSTCFEAFGRRVGHDVYAEFNFAPSARWAAYVFSGYREGRRDLVPAAVPRFDIGAMPNRLELGVSLDLSGTTLDWQQEDLMIGLSAIIETRAGDKSYWALAHPPGDPDFHHPDCFAALLRAPGEA